jgi:hypothetical protein
MKKEYEGYNVIVITSLAHYAWLSKVNDRIKISSTVESWLSDLNGTEGRSDNRKYRIIRKTNEKDEGKYQFNLQY